MPSHATGRRAGGRQAAAHRGDRASTASGLYSLAELQAGCPPGVAPAAKEDALDPADFEKTFKMDRAAFDGLPKWKREKAKKEAGLF